MLCEIGASLGKGAKALMIARQALFSASPSGVHCSWFAAWCQPSVVSDLWFAFTFSNNRRLESGLSASILG